MISLLYKLFETYKLVRRVSVLWAICIITFCTWKIFNADLATLSMSAATAYSSAIGLHVLIIHGYSSSRSKEK